VITSAPLASPGLGSAKGSTIVTIPIIDDAFAEGGETFAVAISNGFGTSIGSQTTATITINDNDGANGSNPLSNNSFFVRQQYLDFLNREPDASGLAFWTNQTTNCGAADLLVCRINVSGAFFLSIEFQQTGYLVERIYKAAFGDAMGTSSLGGVHNLRVPVVRLNQFLPDTQRIGKAWSWVREIGSSNLMTTRMRSRKSSCSVRLS
jgi:hypothetical protein